jgi:hypothetical protein
VFGSCTSVYIELVLESNIHKKAILDFFDTMAHCVMLCCVVLGTQIVSPVVGSIDIAPRKKRESGKSLLDIDKSAPRRKPQLPQTVVPISSPSRCVVPKWVGALEFYFRVSGLCNLHVVDLQKRNHYRRPLFASHSIFKGGVISVHQFSVQPILPALENTLLLEYTLPVDNGLSDA